MFGISIPRNYYYGEGTDHVVKLTKAEADAVTKLNRYLATATSPVMASDEFLAANNVLRPV